MLWTCANRPTFATSEDNKEQPLRQACITKVIIGIRPLDLLMVRKTPLGRLIRKDYHVVPQVLGRNKELAEHFRKMWAKYVGATELVYTRNVEGRKVLLKARGTYPAGISSSRPSLLVVWGWYHMKIGTRSVGLCCSAKCTRSFEIICGLLEKHYICK